MQLRDTVIRATAIGVVLAVSAYNAGPGKVNGAVPRLRETERHVGKVLNYYYRYRNDPAELASAWRSIDAIDIPN